MKDVEWHVVSATPSDMRERFLGSSLRDVAFGRLFSHKLETVLWRSVQGPGWATSNFMLHDWRGEQR